MNFFDNYPSPSYLTLVLFVWALIWKGLALWRAARYQQMNWFVALLILNTVGILEIVYLFYFAKEKMTLIELKNWFKNKLHF